MRALHCKARVRRPARAAEPRVGIDTEDVDTYYVVMNLTLSLDERLVARARRVALSTGKTLNQVIREHLEQITSKHSPDEFMVHLRRLSKQGRGRSKGARFNREEAHARRP